MALAVDGHVTGTWSSGSSFTTTALTTTAARDVIVAFVRYSSTVAFSVSSLATTGVTWQASARNITSTATGKAIELWYGTAVGILTSQITTINLSGTPTNAQASVFAVSGSDINNFTDPNGALPRTNTGNNSIPTVTVVSTTNPNDMIIAGCDVNTAMTQTAGAGFTLIDSVSGTVASEESVVSVVQSGVSVAFGTTSGAVSWAMIVDAIQAPLPRVFAQFDSADVAVTKFLNVRYR